MPIRTGALTATAPRPSRTSELPEYRLDELEFAITTAYYRLVDEPQGWVPLELVREELVKVLEQFKRGPAERVDVDHVIAYRMSMKNKAVLAPESNTKCLTNERVAASIHFGDETLHLMAVSL